MRARGSPCLSELPREWDERLKNWVRINRSQKAKIRGEEVPDRNDEYFLYQTLLGAYPAAGAHDGEFIERLKAYLVKAVREAKVHTEWLKPDEDYEKGFIDFAEAILRPGNDNRFLADFVPFAKSVAHCGMLLSLAQTLLKMTAPGVPDTYQGTEFWDLSFVDPDNRRLVDFAERRRHLADLKTAEARDRIALLRDLLARWQDGRIKLYLNYKLLTARRESAALFVEGEYLPLQAEGAMKDRVCAFARRSNGSWAITIVPRLIGATVFRGGMPLAEFWESSTLRLSPEAPEYWRDVVSGELIEAAGNLLPLAKVFQHFPVALLIQEARAGARPAAEESAHAASGQSIA